MKMESPKKVRMGLPVFALAVHVFASGACASGPEGGGEAGNQPVIVIVDNMASRVLTVERIVATGAVRPVTVRVGVVRGESQQTLTIPWHPSRMAHQILWLDGMNSATYRVEECRGEGPNACTETSALHLPPGAEVTLVIDRRLEATMYYQVPPVSPNIRSSGRW